MTPAPCLSVVVPVYNEGDNIGPCLRGLYGALRDQEHELLICYDFDEDTTLPAIEALSERPPTIRLVKNPSGRGVAAAIRAGFAAARGDVVVVTMADLSDPPAVIPAMARKIREEGADVVSGSRYMPGGSQQGGPRLKTFLSRAAGLSLRWGAGLDTHDATTNFRAYRKSFLDQVHVESRNGFELALELTVKAHLRGGRVSEVPSTWTDRSAGQSRFRLWKWLPAYLRWYGAAMAAPIFVGLIFLAAAMAAMAFALRHAPAVPFWDDWSLVPVVTGQQPLTLDWLWELHNEHRIPIPKLLGVLLGRWSGMDGRWGAALNAALLAAAAAVLLRGLARRRGRLLWTDAVIPILFLNGAHGDNLIWPFQLTFTLPAFLLALLAAGALGGRPALTLGSALGGAAVLLALSLCSAGPLPFVPFLAVGLLGVVWRGRYEGSKGTATILPLLALLATGVTLLGYQRPASIPPCPGIPAAAGVALGSLAGSAGYLAERAWPWSGAAALLLLLGTLGLLLRRWGRAPADRFPVGALLLLLAGQFGVAAALGIGRSGLSPFAGFTPRYATLTVFFPVLFYLAIEFAATPAAQRVLRTGCLALFAGLAAANAVQAWDLQQERRATNAAITADAQAGLPLRLLSSRYQLAYYPRRDGTFLSGLERLAEKRMSLYRRIEPPAPSLFDAAGRNGAELLQLEDGRPAIAIRPGTSFQLPLPAGVRQIRLELGLAPEAPGTLELQVELMAAGGDAKPLWWGTLRRDTQEARFSVSASGASLRFSSPASPRDLEAKGWVVPTIVPAP